jgi:hypothetical protein
MIYKCVKSSGLQPTERNINSKEFRIVLYNCLLHDNFITCFGKVVVCSFCCSNVADYSAGGKRQQAGSERTQMLRNADPSNTRTVF